MDISLLRITLYTSFFGVALVLFFIALILLPWIIEYSKISINWRRYFKVDKVTKSNFTPVDLKEIKLGNNYGKSYKFFHVFPLKKIHEREKSTSYDGKSLSGLKLGLVKAAATSRSINSEYKLVAKGRGDVAISNRHIYISSKDNRNVKRKFDLKMVDEISLYESDRVVFISSLTQGVFPLKLTFLNYKDAAHFINIFWTIYSDNFDPKGNNKKVKPIIIDGPMVDDNGVPIVTKENKTSKKNKSKVNNK